MRTILIALSVIAGLSLAQNPYEDDPTVGTAYAPVRCMVLKSNSREQTTPGGTCTNSLDYHGWTTSVTYGSTVTKTGYDIWPTDLQTCATYCIPGMCALLH